MEDQQLVPCPASPSSSVRETTVACSVGRTLQQYRQMDRQIEKLDKSVASLAGMEEQNLVLLKVNVAQMNGINIRLDTIQTSLDAIMRKLDITPPASQKAPQAGQLAIEAPPPTTTTTTTSPSIMAATASLEAHVVNGSEGAGSVAAGAGGVTKASKKAKRKARRNNGKNSNNNTTSNNNNVNGEKNTTSTIVAAPKLGDTTTTVTSGDGVANNLASSTKMDAVDISVRSSILDTLVGTKLLPDIMSQMVDKKVSQLQHDILATVTDLMDASMDRTSASINKNIKGMGEDINGIIDKTLHTMVLEVEALKTVVADINARMTSSSSSSSSSGSAKGGAGSSSAGKTGKNSDIRISVEKLRQTVDSHSSRNKSELKKLQDGHRDLWEEIRVIKMGLQRSKFGSSPCTIDED